MKKYRFRRWLRNWLHNFDSDIPQKETLSVSARRQLNDTRDAMNFHIYRATGGYIVEYVMYDRKRDENNRNLHIIAEEQDLGDAIAKVVTVEMLRH